jgi:hypothetical protein
MDAILNFLGLQALVGYEYLLFIFKGCFAIFFITEVLEWFKLFTKQTIRM